MLPDRFRNPRSGVVDTYQYAFLLRDDVHRQAPYRTVRHRIERIVEQIHQYLFQAVAFAQRIDVFNGDVLLEGDMFQPQPPLD